MDILIEDSKLRDRRLVFKDRAEAGRLLAAELDGYRGADGMVLAIPAGGVPVAVEIAGGLDLAMDLIIVHKVQVPYNAEVGFGAMDPEGGILFNEPLLRQLALSYDAIQQQIEKTRKVIEQRNRLFREGRPFPFLGEKTAIVVDDGLASGYTLKAAVRYVRRNNPSRIIAAVPTGSAYSVKELLPEVEEIVCLNVRSGFPFAVAEAYRQWHDVRDEEVLSLLKK